MNRKKLFGKIAVGVALTFIILFFAISITLNDIKQYEVDVMSKGALLPYQKYDYMTTEDSFYNIDRKPEVIPAYFRTDFASIPRFLWFVDAPYRAEFVYPAIWHDYHYACPGKRTRKEIDDIFYNLLLNEQSSPWSAIKMYIAVRLFGSSHFFEKGLCDEIIIQEQAEDKEFYEKEVIDDE